MMDPDEIRAALMAALPLRPPKFDVAEGEPRPAARQKVEQFEDYLLQSAYVRAELEEALHWTDALIAHFTAKVSQITGYEVSLPRKPRDRITQADINAAKRIVDPVSFEIGAEMKQVRVSLLRQIERFAFEEQFVISRAYTMLSGG